MVSKEKIGQYSCWLLFVILIGYLKLYHHELWKDEWQAWFVSKDKTIGQILSFLYYEGHPALWYLYLKVFAFFESTMHPAQLLNIAHLFTVAAGLYILFIKFRLPLLIKVFFASSYFLFFEYGIVNRGYFFVILFSCLAAYLIRTDKAKQLPLAITLFLLCQTEVYGVFVATALIYYFFLGIISDQSLYKNKAIIGYLAGVFVFVVSVFPRSTSHVSLTKSKNLSWLDEVLISFQGNFSNTYLLGSTYDTFTYGWTLLGTILSLFCLIGLYLIFKKDKKLLLIYGLFLMMMLVFSKIFFLGGVRQWGMGFIFFMVMLELRGLDMLKEKLVSYIIIIFCAFSIIHNVQAVYKDIQLPFTNAEKAGSFIAEKVPAKVPIVAINKFEATPVIGYAQRSFFELPSGNVFTYFRWVDKIYIPTENELKLFAKFKKVGGLVIISPKPLDKDRFPSAQLWQKFDTENYKKENYYLYSMSVK